VKDAPITAEVVTLHVPFRLEKRGGRKAMVLPEGATAKRPQPNNTLVKALARAFRWKRMLESGEYATIGDLAAHERIAPSYMTRVMRLTLLAPEIVEAIVTDKAEVGLAELLEPFPGAWATQETYLQVFCQP
jgi:hypothetical protein